MTTRRILPPEEYGRLVGTEAEGLIPILRPEDGDVLVVEEDGRIVGCWTLLRCYHAECLWIAPDRRRSAAVVIGLLTDMVALAKAKGARVIYTAALTESVRRLLSKVRATRVPGDPYVWPI